MENVEEIVKAVCALRTITGDTQLAFACRLGLSLRTISNYEKDRVPNDGPLVSLISMAHALGRLDLTAVLIGGLSSEVRDLMVAKMLRDDQLFYRWLELELSAYEQNGSAACAGSEEWESPWKI